MQHVNTLVTFIAISKYGISVEVPNLIWLRRRFSPNEFLLWSSPSHFMAMLFVTQAETLVSSFTPLSFSHITSIGSTFKIHEESSQFSPLQWDHLCISYHLSQLEISQWSSCLCPAPRIPAFEVCSQHNSQSTVVKCEVRT